MSLVPFGVNIVVSEIKPSKETESGIILPDSVSGNNRLLRGLIRSVGQNPTLLKVGDIVVFDKKNAHPIKEDGEDYLIFPEDGVLAVVKQDSPVKCRK
jgi:co-chaperonin GroES (HSP10)